MIHELAVVEPGAIIDRESDSVHVWRFAHIRTGAVIGREVTIGGGAFIDHDVIIGPWSKVENNAMIFWPALIDEGVFVGPGVVLANDKWPNAKNDEDWLERAKPTRLGRGCSIGANAVIMPGLTIGEGARVGAGAVVTRDVPDGETYVGVPAHRIGDGPLDRHEDPDLGYFHRREDD